MEKNQNNFNEEQNDLAEGFANIIRFFAEMSGVRANVEINRENTNRGRTKLDIMMAIRNFEAEMNLNPVEEEPIECIPAEDTTKEPTKFEKVSDCLEQKTQKNDGKNINGKPF